jgi:hypothetical protein
VKPFSRHQCLLYGIGFFPLGISRDRFATNFRLLANKHLGDYSGTIRNIAGGAISNIVGRPPDTGFEFMMG